MHGWVLNPLSYTGWAKATLDSVCQQGVQVTPTHVLLARHGGVARQMQELAAMGDTPRLERKTPSPPVWPSPPAWGESPQEVLDTDNWPGRLSHWPPWQRGQH